MEFIRQIKILKDCKGSLTGSDLVTYQAGEIVDCPGPRMSSGLAEVLVGSSLAQDAQSVAEALVKEPDVPAPLADGKPDLDFSASREAEGEAKAAQGKLETRIKGKK